MRSMPADSNYVGNISSYLRVWYESHHAFPTDEYEFAQAMAEGPANWAGQCDTDATEPIQATGAGLAVPGVGFSRRLGPRIDDLSDRPGVIYYCVSPDLQKFWATMTGLDSDVAPSAAIKRVADLSYEKVAMAQAVGSDYPRDEKALQQYREKVKTDPGYRQPLAETLNHLGVMYANTQRRKEAEDAYKEALEDTVNW